MTNKHSYMVVSTDFELEPLLDQYLATYPEGQLQSYSVVFKTSSDESWSYIIVFALFSPKVKVVRFSEFLDAYCKLNNKVAVANPVNSVFPDFKHAHQQRSHVFGNLKQGKDAIE